eukprot:CAMPEP_0115067066 /NCGR_PEP_ID=MMETSP0227-20121206/11173_1 /TAXON_ID=89957 /ORGANISM="Polarella glacialis, Strain CCMP 1383" /LENGTH=49 /DNA_ID=CAMNT_0002453071 /DNA_START=398 /DNA_END=547 /DNA_ORIENTATION=+
MKVGGAAKPFPPSRAARPASREGAFGWQFSLSQKPSLSGSSHSSPSMQG